MEENREVIKPEYKKLLSDEEVVALRKNYPLLDKKVYVANCSQGAQSLQVRGAINEYLDSWQNDGMDWDRWLLGVEGAKREFAELIGASGDEIAIACSVSDAVSSIATALDFSGGRKKVVIGDGDFPTVNYNWLAQEKNGAEIDFVPVRDDLQIDIKEYEKRIDDNTLITSYAHVYYLNGFKQDIKAIASIAHENGSLAMVDVYQSLGTCPVDVKEMDIDILVCGGMKFMLGPAGIAFLYIKKDIIDSLKPEVTGWFGQRDPFLFQSRYIDWAVDARRFDTGTPPVMAAYAAGAAIKSLNEIGMDKIHDRVQMLSGYTVEQCLSHGLKVVSPMDISKKGASTAIWVTDKISSHQAEEAMKKKNIVISARGDVVRIAPHFYNTVEEIETAVTELAKLLS